MGGVYCPHGTITKKTRNEHSMAILHGSITGKDAKRGQILEVEAEAGYSRSHAVTHTRPNTFSRASRVRISVRTGVRVTYYYRRGQTPRL